LEKYGMKFLFNIFFLLGTTSGVVAQSDSTLTVELENIIIQGNRINTPFKESSRNISVITEQIIQNLPANSIPEILSYVPGVDIRQRGPVGVQTDIGIRGGSFEQTLVLINGIKLTDPQTGHHSLNVPLNFNNLKRIEVLKGPGARIYGQNAFSGAVNFITSVSETGYAGLHIYGGNHKLFGGTLDASLPVNKYKQYISFSRDASDGYRYNTDFKITNLFYQAETKISGGTLEILGGWTDRKFGANGFYANPDYSDQYEEVWTSILGVGFVKSIGDFMIHPRVYWRMNNDNYFFVRNNPEIYQNDHTTNVGALEINTHWKNTLGQTGLGLEYRREGIKGDWVRGGTHSKSNLDGFYRNNFGMFIEHQFKYGKFDFTPGVYITHYSDFGWNAFPGIDAGFLLRPDLRLYSNIGKSYRIPTFYDMYYKSPVEEGNPDLDPEKAITFEIGGRYMKSPLNIEFNWFYQDAHDLIDWIGLPVTDSTYLWKSANISNIKRSGIEIATQLIMERLVDKKLILKNIYLSYNFINSDLTSPVELSRYVLENLRHQLILGINTRIISNIYLDFKTRMNKREGASHYWVLDSRLYWDKKKGPYLYIEATNLTNTQYSEVMTPMPGRWFRAGIMYQLGF
jgi:iron complex outermembrane receptor protein